MALEALLSELERRGVELSVSGEELRFRAPRGALSADLRQSLKEHKPELLAWLRLRDASADGARELERVPRDGPLAASYAQQQLWLLHRLQPHAVAYNEPAALRLKGRLDRRALALALRHIVRRHEVLRTTFSERAGRPVQVIAAAPSAAGLAVPWVDLTRLDGDDREHEARRRAEQEAQRPFDLERGPLLRVVLLCSSPRDHVLLLTLHHILTDGWSFAVLWRELATLYQDFAAGRGASLPELTVQYADWAAWQRQWLKTEVAASQLAYWRQSLAGAPELLELPTDRPPPAVASDRGARAAFLLPPQLGDDLRRLGRARGATLFQTLLTGFVTLLHRHAEVDDVVLGTPVANRRHRELEGMIGFFANAVVLRLDLSATEVPSFGELLAEARRVSLGAFANQDLPFERLVSELATGRGRGRTPLFQVMFMVQNAPRSTLQLPDLTLHQLEVEHRRAKFDLALGMSETPAGGLFGSFEYRTDLFDATTVGRWGVALEALLTAFADDPDTGLAEAPLLAASARHQLLREWNDTAVEPAGDVTVHQLFEAVADRTPDTVALAAKGEFVTYGALECEANRLAHRLRRLGVAVEERVALCVERSPVMVMALLGIAKAGGAYLPIDPSWPLERVGLLLEDGRPRVLLISRGAPTPEVEGVRVLQLDRREWRSESSLPPAVAPPRRAAAANLFYVIYTSGSTGRPKGVLVEHRSVVNVVTSFIRTYSVGPGDRLLQQTSLAFDVSACDIFGMLSSGGTLVLLEPGVALDLDNLSSVIARGRISIVAAVPSLLTQLNSRRRRLPPTLRLILSGGEALSGSDIDHLIGAATVVNGYGPTEATICASSFPLPPGAGRRFRGAVVPIGRPLACGLFYVLDESRLQVLVGRPGELHIGGLGIARGYLGLPARTASSFLPDPFSGDFGGRLYATGDRVRQLADGNVEFLGRVDGQVKVRGYRIETGEVEDALGRHPAVRQALVDVRDDAPGGRALVAYWMAHEDATAVVSELAGFLHQRLPRYMVPSAFVRIERWPRMPTGKVDRRALPSPKAEGSERAAASVPPRSELERQLCALWEELVGVEGVGVHDDFFELGGNSILTLQVASRAEERGLRLSPAVLYLHPTVAELAVALDAGKGEVSVSGSERASVVAVGPASQEAAGRVLFCVHPDGGDLSVFRPLARRLAEDRSLLAVRWPAPEAAEVTLEELARRCLEAVRQRQASGPYFLAGWSSGGVVAFEMASQFAAAGLEVAFLALLDTATPKLLPTAPPSPIDLAEELFGADWLHQLAPRLAYLRRQAPEEQLSALIAATRMTDPDADRWRSLWRTACRRRELMANYHPRPYLGPLTLLRAIETDRLHANRQDGRGALGWEKASDAVTVHRVAGSHRSMLDEPQVAEVAAVLRASLASSATASGSG